jgi:hypothetical protein
MIAAVRELEVIARVGQSKHDTVKTFVILETVDDAKTKALAIHGPRSRQVAYGSGNPQRLVMPHSWATGFTTTAPAFLACSITALTSIFDATLCPMVKLRSADLPGSDNQLSRDHFMSCARR